MLMTLPESSRRSKRSTSWTLVSVAAHAAALSIWVTSQGLPEVTAAPREEPIFIDPPQRPEPVRRDPVEHAGPTTSGAPTIPRLPTIEPPTVHIPIIDEQPSSAIFDDEAYRRRGTFAPSTDASPTAAADPRTVFDEHTVDRRVEPRAGNPVPRYPPALSSAGVNGNVLVRFVVDTLGAVDRGSVQVVHATHALFERSVMEVLVRMRFVPAQVGNRNVRQLVEMPFHFRVER